MSTILEALKRVEEQLRNDARLKTAGSVKGGLEPSHARDDLAPQTKDTVSEESDEATRIYLSLVDMISRIGERVQTGVEQERSKAKKTIDSLSKAVAGLQEELAHQREMLQNVSRQQEAEREAGKAALAAAQSQIDPLRLTNTETQEAIGELARVTTLLKQELATQREALQEETRKREAEDKAGTAESGEALSAALSGISKSTQSQIESLREALAETRESHNALVAAMTALRNDLAGQQDALKEETRRRNADRESAQAALAQTQSNTDSLKQSQAETKGACAELLKNVDGLRDDLVRLGKAHNQEVKQREAEGKKAEAAWAAAQAQFESLQRALAEAKGIHAESAREIGVLRDNLALLGKARQEEVAQREAKRKAGKTAFAAAQSQLDSLEQAIADARGFQRESAQALAALRDDLAHHREALQKETQRRDSSARSAESVLASLQSQIDLLKQAFSKHDATATDGDNGLSITETSYSAMAEQKESKDASNESGKQGLESPPTMDADEAQRLHRVAGDAYARGEYAEALRLLDTIDAAFPDNKSILYNQVECLIGLGHKDDARRLCDYLVNNLKHTAAKELRHRIEV